MKIDIWTHILSPAYSRHLRDAGSAAGIGGQFLLGQRALTDVEYRLQVMKDSGDYRQVLAPITGPPPPAMPTLNATIELVRRNNEELAEIVALHPDPFFGFVAATPLSDCDAATEEAVRSIRELGALGVQLEEDALNLPLHEPRYLSLLQAVADLGAGIWLHPHRGPATPGFPVETSRYGLWQALTWPFDTSVTVALLVMSGTLDKIPDLKLIAHHGGGLIPHFSGRIRQFMNATNDGPSLTRQPLDYFRSIYVDTALFGAPQACRCVIDFFGTEHVLFGTDAPFDGADGTRFVPWTAADVEDAVLDSSSRDAIYFENAIQLLAVKPPLRMSGPAVEQSE